MPMWNALNLARAYRACAAGLALVILPVSVSVAEAEYGPRTTIGKNYQQWSNTRAGDAIDQAFPCNGAGTCFALFQRIPQQKPLIVQHVSCVISVSAGELRYGELRTRKGQGIVSRTTYLVLVNAGGNLWVLNSPVMHLFKSGERPVVRFVNSGAANWGPVECTISGRLQQP